MPYSWSESLFLPSQYGEFSELHAERWFENVEIEIANSSLAAGMRPYYYAAGLVDNPWRLRFFHHHFSAPLSRAVAHLFSHLPNGGTIIDLGCGYGTQSILFALLGARVVAIDLEGPWLGVLKSRIEYYQAVAGRALDIEIIGGDARRLDFAAFSPCAGLYSLFAFQVMLPNGPLIEAFSRAMASGARLSIHDGNRAWMLMKWRRRNLTTVGLKEALQKNGWRVADQTFMAVWPPPLWRLTPGWTLKASEQWLSRAHVLAKSCQTLATYAPSEEHAERVRRHARSDRSED